MIFGGRERELATLNVALAEDRRVLIYGSFGMGRSSLVRRFAELHKARYLFARTSMKDGSHRACRKLFDAFVSSLPVSRRPRVSPIRFGQCRAELLGLCTRHQGQILVLLDDLCRASSPVRILIQDLIRVETLRLVVIPDPSLPERDRSRLEAWLYPLCRLELRRLGRTESETFFRLVAEQACQTFSDAELRAMRDRSGGYPLLMMQEARLHLSFPHNRAPEGS